MKQRFTKRTRLVSALLTLAMVFTFLPISAFAEGEGRVPIGEDNYGPFYFPDSTFRTYLSKFDKNTDGYLNKTELDEITEISVAGEGITNLQGIHFFPNLEQLNCGNNQLKALNVKSNLNLKQLNCSENQLTELNVWENDQLTELDCGKNYLTSLDLQYNTELTKLNCARNQLTSLGVSKNTKLTFLDCTGNQLTSLDVSKNEKLEYLYCTGNQLTSLDVSKNEKLNHLCYGYNQLTSLQADNCTNLGYIQYDNNEYSVQVYESTRVLDPGILPGNFDISRVRNLVGADKTADGKLKVHDDASTVTYEYRYLNNNYAPFTLNVEVIPDGSIAIDTLNFPDPNFRAYVKAEFAGNSDSLSESEQNAVTEIDVMEGYNGQKITSLKGIEFFPNLERLLCSENNLTSLDVSKNIALKVLWCEKNNLTSLDVSKNTALVALDCHQNSLTSLDVSQTAVTSLDASGNQIDIDVDKTSRTFDLSILPGFDVTKAGGWVGGDVDGNTLKVKPGVTQVTYTYDCGKGRNATFTLNVKVVSDGSIAIDTLNFPDPNFRAYVKAEFAGNSDSLSESEQNAVTEIDVMEGYNGQKITSLKGIEFFPNLERLLCSENNLTSLDVSKNIALKVLWCEKNNLTSLDVSKNTALVALDCHQNSLTSLDVSQTAVTSLDASGNQIDINVEKTPRTFDLSTLPGFDASRASNWVGGDVSGKTLTVDEGVNQVAYTYDCGKGRNATFTLNVNVVPDGSTGGTTIPPEAGKYQLTVTDGVATVNGITRDVLNVKPGDTVTLTADTTKFPENEEFGWWEITPYGSVSNTLTGQYQRTATFTMPNENVSARAMSKSAGVSTGGDDGGGGGAAILLVGGAAVAGLVGYGVYSYVSEQQLKALLPEGVAMPENRAQTALLLWNTAGRPEPAEAPAFKDVADPDTAKAAQWCVGRGLKNKHPQRTAPELKQPGHALRMLLLCGGARRQKQKIRTLLFRETVRIFLVWCE